jgi:hypothetical protein
MAKEIHLDSELRKFLGNKKTNELKSKMKALYFDQKFWREKYNDLQDKIIRAYVCKDKTYGVRVANFNTNEWKYTPNDCIGLFINFPSKSMSEEQRIRNFEWQWQVTASGAKAKYMLKDR